MEAQILKVDKDKIFVHYNEWGDRLNEWINYNSNRLAPFRSHTVQSPNSKFMSPYPVNQRKIEYSKNQNDNID